MLPGFGTLYLVTQLHGKEVSYMSTQTNEEAEVSTALL